MPSVSLGFTFHHFVSRGVTWFQPVSRVLFDFNWFHVLVVLYFTGFHVGSHDMTLVHLLLYDFNWCSFNSNVFHFIPFDSMNYIEHYVMSSGLIRFQLIVYDVMQFHVFHLIYTCFTYFHLISLHVNWFHLVSL